MNTYEILTDREKLNFYIGRREFSLSIQMIIRVDMKVNTKDRILKHRKQGIK